MKLSIIMGSKSDLAIAKKASQILDEFEQPYDMRVLSAHRTIEELFEYIQSFEAGGGEIIIAIAGKAAHLPGVIAAKSILPVIGVPVKTSFMGGMESILSILQMPKGVPVATVGVDAGENAALLALRMLCLNDKSLQEKYHEFLIRQRDAVLSDDQEIQEER